MIKKFQFLDIPFTMKMYLLWKVLSLLHTYPFTTFFFFLKWTNPSLPTGLFHFFLGHEAVEFRLGLLNIPLFYFKLSFICILPLFCYLYALTLIQSFFNLFLSQKHKLMSISFKYQFLILLLPFNYCLLSVSLQNKNEKYEIWFESHNSLSCKLNATIIH